MLGYLSNWSVTVSYYALCYIIILLILSVSLLLTIQNLNLNWNTNTQSAKGPKLLLFLCLVALTGLPPMFTLAPKLHLIAFILSKSNIVGILILFSLILLSWFVYFSALRNFNQTNNNISLINNNHTTTSIYIICSFFILFFLIAPFFVDDIILWVYYFIGK